MQVGAAIVTYGRPAVLLDALAALRSSTRPPDRIHVHDNSPDRWGDPPADISYEWTGENLGLPGALGRCFRRLAEVDHVLVLDDDTVVEPETIEQLVALVAPGVGAVSIPTPYTRSIHGDGERRVFPWSPTLLARDAIDAAGAPKAELFFGWDDYDYATRIRRAGFRILWAEARLPRQGLQRMWPGRLYLSARNATYLVTRRRLAEPSVRAQVRGHLATAARGRRDPVTRIVRRGVVDGLLGRLGPPPPELSPSLEVARWSPDEERS